MTLEPLILKMISYDHGSPERIQHFLKVHSFAKTIAVSEHLDEKTLFITEAAAIVHDIGIRLCLEKYGDGNGKLQETACSQCCIGGSRHQADTACPVNQIDLLFSQKTS